jgi:hypothetical protein
MYNEESPYISAFSLKYKNGIKNILKKYNIDPNPFFDLKLSHKTKSGSERTILLSAALISFSLIRIRSRVIIELVKLGYITERIKSLMTPIFEGEKLEHKKIIIESSKIDIEKENKTLKNLQEAYEKALKKLLSELSTNPKYKANKEVLYTEILKYNNTISNETVDIMISNINKYDIGEITTENIWGKLYE